MAATPSTSSIRRPARPALVNHRRDGLHVRPARQLGHHAAEHGVHVLRQDDEAPKQDAAGPGLEQAAEVSSQEVSMPRIRSTGRQLEDGRARRLAEVALDELPVGGDDQSCAPITRLMIVPSLSSRKLSGTPVVW